MIRLIALDLDNTLLEKNNQIHPRTLSLLRRCSENDIYVVIATGRLLLSAQKYARQIGPHCKIICYNGCLVTESDGTQLYSAHLSVEMMRKIVTFCKERNLYCQFYSDHKILVEKVTDGTTIDPDLANTEAIEAGSFDSYPFSPSPKAMIVAPPGSVPGYIEELNEFLEGGAYLAQSQPYLIEIMPENIFRDEVMACGDNSNDAEMLEWAGTGVAVANSVESLRPLASYICKEERSLGVAEAIEKFCMI